MSNICRFTTACRISSAKKKVKRFGIGGVRGDGTSRRFYDNVTVEAYEGDNTNSYVVCIDGRLLHTACNRLMVLPYREIGLIIAGEWAFQTKFIRASSMPFTHLVATAFDQFNVPSERDPILLKARTYLETDTTFFRAIHDVKDTALSEAQSRAWDPLLDWIATKFNARFTPSTELSSPQPKISLDRTHAAIESVGRSHPNEPNTLNSALKLAALDAVASEGRSYIIGLAFIYDRFTNVQECVSACRVDEEFQIGRGGKVLGAHDIDHAFVTMKIKAAESLLSCLRVNEHTYNV